MKEENFIMMPIPASSFRAVCALLGGAALAVGTGFRPEPTDAGDPGPAGFGGGAPAAPVTVDVSGVASTQENGGQAGTGPTATTGASPSDPNDIDAHGHPFDPNLHASTKTKTKEGLWRMKPGQTRPDPKPGFPVGDAGTGTSSTAGAGTNSATSQGATGPAVGQAVTVDEDDEFAAFREAAANSEATDANAAANVPPRQYTDADLGALCNQAAHKLGKPDPVKEKIVQFVPQGEVAHSRNIPAERRAEFVKVIEELAGIQFAG